MSERTYLDLLVHVLEHGQRRPTRAHLPSTGRSVDALTVFAPAPLRFDLGAGFPLLTTKRVNLRGIAAELLWFLSGSTDVRDLQAMGCRIWDAWADDRGEVGPSYGHNWRSFQRHHDQLAELVEGIRAVAEDGPGVEVSRRLLLTALDPATAYLAALYPCHVLAQWDVDPETRRLSCQVYQRSADLFLGVPWNIASYALLTHLLASVAGLDVGSLTLVLGNAHIYTNHLEQAREQIAREPHAPPRLTLPTVRFRKVGHGRDLPVFCTSRDVPLTPDHFGLDGYDPHPALRGEVAV